jgi:hypothetical protein
MSQQHDYYEFYIDDLDKPYEPEELNRMITSAGGDSELRTLLMKYNHFKWSYVVIPAYGVEDQGDIRFVPDEEFFAKDEMKYQLYRDLLYNDDDLWFPLNRYTSRFLGKENKDNILIFITKLGEKEHDKLNVIFLSPSEKVTDVISQKLFIRFLEDTKTNSFRRLQSAMDYASQRYEKEQREKKKKRGLLRKLTDYVA